MSCTELLPPPTTSKRLCFRNIIPITRRNVSRFICALQKALTHGGASAAPAQQTPPLPRRAAVFLSASLSFPRDFLSVVVALVLLGSAEGGVG